MVLCDLVNARLMNLSELIPCLVNAYLNNLVFLCVLVDARVKNLSFVCALVNARLKI